LTQDRGLRGGSVKAAWSNLQIGGTEAAHWSLKARALMAAVKNSPG
jgi:hypothetical protein